MSVHPLIGDLSGLTDAMLNEKINELNKRLNAAFRMGYMDAVQQLQMFLSDYQAELSRRNAKAMEALAAKAPEFKNIIDVG